jgi:hypothetical protein
MNLILDTSNQLNFVIRPNKYPLEKFLEKLNFLVVNQAPIYLGVKVSVKFTT